MFQWFNRTFRRVTCDHDWQDGYTFASCVEVTIPRGESRPVCFRVMQFCDLCGAYQRRMLTKAEYDAWDVELRDAWDEGDDHVDIDYLRDTYPAQGIEAGTAETAGLGPKDESPVTK